MAKSNSSRARRRVIERNLKKGRGFNNLTNEQLLHSIRHNLNSNQFKSLINKLDEDKLEYLKGNPLPKSYSEINQIERKVSYDDIEKEIFWSSWILQEHSNEINLFVKYQNLFESLFINGEYSKASDCIEKIEKEICVSYWSIEKKILLSEFQSGFKKNKETLTDIVSENNYASVNILARFQSIRVERNLSHFKYQEIFYNYLNQYKENNILNYLLYKLDYFSQLDFDNKGFILWFDSQSSIIDNYITFKSCKFK